MNNHKMSRCEFDKLRRNYFKLIKVENVFKLSDRKLNRLNPELKENILLGRNSLDNLHKFKPILLEILSYFDCRRCGKCCRCTHPDVFSEEIFTIANEIGEDVFNGLENQNTFKSPCYFLEENTCSIYKVRPSVCCIYPFSIHNPEYITLVIGCPMSEDIQKQNENMGTYIKNATIEQQKQYNKVNGLNDNDNHDVHEMLMNWNFLPKFLAYLRSKS